MPAEFEAEVWYCAHCLRPDDAHLGGCPRTPRPALVAQCVACDRDVTDHEPGLGLCRFVAEADTPMERLHQALGFAMDPLAGSLADRQRFKDRVLRAAEELSR